MLASQAMAHAKSERASRRSRSCCASRRSSADVEPHSPISYAIETLVARGRMNLIDLLDELLLDAGSRSQFLQVAGIGPKAIGRRSD